MFLPEQMRSLFLLNSGEGEQLVDVGCVVVPSGDLREQIIENFMIRSWGSLSAFSFLNLLQIHVFQYQ